jgi:hypothetical protein
MLHPIAAPNLRPRSPARSLRTHPGTLFVPDRGFEIRIQLLLQLSIHARLLEQRLKTGNQVFEPFHGSPQTNEAYSEAVRLPGFA